MPISLSIITLIKSFTAVVFGLTMGSLPADNLIYCHDITLIDNNVVEPNRVFEVKISQSSLWPSSTIIRNGTLTMTIINDDGKYLL